jgi:SAM-dependent methyltransferase
MNNKPVPGEAFKEQAVAECYTHRPPYPEAIFTRLVELAPARTAALDLGCGPGKITLPLSLSFDHVTAVDPSEAMLKIARSQAEESTSNITWVNGLAETASFPDHPYDLVVAGASIHWMDQEIVFPRLLDVVSSNHIFAVIEGDGAYDPPWKEDFHAFLKYWIFELKREQYEPQSDNTPHLRFMTRYRQHVDIAGDIWMTSEVIKQKLGDFILCQHSRDTFAPSKLGARIRQFDAELESILRPFAVEDRLSYQVRTNMTWGTIAPRTIAPRTTASHNSV